MTDHSTITYERPTRGFVIHGVVHRTRRTGAIVSSPMRTFAVPVGTRCAGYSHVNTTFSGRYVWVKMATYHNVRVGSGYPIQGLYPIEETDEHLLFPWEPPRTPKYHMFARAVREGELQLPFGHTPPPRELQAVHRAFLLANPILPHHPGTPLVPLPPEHRNCRVSHRRTDQ